MTLVKVTGAGALLVPSVSVSGAAASSGAALSPYLGFPTWAAGMMMASKRDLAKTGSDEHHARKTRLRLFILRPDQNPLALVPARWLKLKRVPLLRRRAESTHMAPYSRITPSLEMDHVALP